MQWNLAHAASSTPARETFQNLSSAELSSGDSVAVATDESDCNSLSSGSWSLVGPLGIEPRTP